jgi:hypothetical protein
LRKTQKKTNYRSIPSIDCRCRRKKTANLEMRLKCGAARKDLAWKTVEQIYTVSGSADQFTFSRVVCDPGRHFTINGSSGGGSAISAVTPSGQSQGLYALKGSRPEEIGLYGDGPVRIIPGEDGAGTLEMGG